MQHSAPPWYAVPIVLVLGLIAALLSTSFVPHARSSTAVILTAAVPFAASGLAAGLAWPGVLWRWVLLLSAALAAILAVHALGNERHYQPTVSLLAAISGAVVGVWVGGKIGRDLRSAT